MMVSSCNRDCVLLLLVALGSLQLSQAQPDGAVRLVGAPSSNCGRVEVFHDGEWGTVCDYHWDYVVADVVCKQLGYRHASQRFSRAYYGQGNGPIWLESLRCSSGYSSILECRHKGWGVHDCSHAEDAGLCCERVPAPKPPSLPVRLTCPKCATGEFCKTCPDKTGPDPIDCHPQPMVAGIVEVQVNGVWGPVSAEGWDINEATVVCGELGYPISFPIGGDPPTIEDVWPEYTLLTDDSNTLGSGEEPLTELVQCLQSYSHELQQLSNNFSHSFLQQLECTGKERHLLDCFFSGIGFHPNPTRRVAAVQCGFKPHYSCLPPELRTIRLRAGAVPWKGRVEIKVNREWGTICESGFDVVDANVVCRHLGFGSVKTAMVRAGRGVGKIHLTQIRCTGSESRIEDCGSMRGQEAEQCGHKGDVGVECNTPDTSQCSEHVLYNVNMKEYGSLTYPQIRGWLGWGLFCYSDTPIVTTAVGEVICRQTRKQFLAGISKDVRPLNYIGLHYIGRIDCTGDELSLLDCDVTILPRGWCPYGYTIVNCTSAAADLVPDIPSLRRSLQSRFTIQVQPMASLQCAYDEGCLSSSAWRNGGPRTLLRFDSMTWNWGLSDFEPVAAREDWQWHSCHYHYHSMEEFVHYNLLDVDTGRKVAEGHKASFCLEDTTCAPNYYQLFNCFSGNQGVSANCGDLYGSHLDCQWIDITGVPLGRYLLQVTVNPQRLSLESDYDNNQATCRIETKEAIDVYSNRYYDAVEVQECWLSDH